MVDSSNDEMFNEACDLVESIGKMDGPVRLTLPFLYNTMWMLIQGDSKRAKESLTNASNMMHMVIYEPENAQDFYDFLIRKGALQTMNGEEGEPDHDNNSVNNEHLEAP